VVSWRCKKNQRLLESLLSAKQVVLPKENHMQLTEAATLDRKSGEAEGSAVPRTSPRNANWLYGRATEPVDTFFPVGVMRSIILLLGS
jgi:hypothetical protein